MATIAVIESKAITHRINEQVSFCLELPSEVIPREKNECVSTFATLLGISDSAYANRYNDEPLDRYMQIRRPLKPSSIPYYNPKCTKSYKNRFRY